MCQKESAITYYVEVCLGKIAQAVYQSANSVYLFSKSCVHPPKSQLLSMIRQGKISILIAKALDVLIAVSAGHLQEFPSSSHFSLSSL